MSQHDEDTKEKLSASLKKPLLTLAIGLAVMGVFAFTAWNSSASGFAGMSLNATQDLKQEEFLRSISDKLSNMKLVSRVNSRTRSIKIFSNDVNFANNSAKLSERQSQALGRVSQLIQAAMQCTDTNSELQLAAKPLDGTPTLSRAQCHTGEKIDFACNAIFRELKIKRIIVSANETSHSLSTPEGARHTHSQILQQRNDVLVDAMHSCEPELRRYSFADSKPILRNAAMNGENSRDLERLQLKFEFN